MTQNETPLDRRPLPPATPTNIIVGVLALVGFVALVAALLGGTAWLILEPVGGVDLSLREAFAAGLLLILARLRFEVKP